MELGDLGLGEQIQFKSRSVMRCGHSGSRNSGSCSTRWLPESPHQGGTCQAALEAAGLCGHPSFLPHSQDNFHSGSIWLPFPYTVMVACGFHCQLDTLENHWGRKASVRGYLDQVSLWACLWRNIIEIERTSTVGSTIPWAEGYDELNRMYIHLLS